MRGLFFLGSQEKKLRLYQLATSLFLVLIVSFACSPIAMVLVPRLNVIQLKSEHLKCDSECDGLLISFSFKLLILLLGSWALFFR